jgi:hypothetical protein
MKTRPHFTLRIDRWDDDGENIIEHLAGVEDQLPVPVVAAR